MADPVIPAPPAQAPTPAAAAPAAPPAALSQGAPPQPTPILGQPAAGGAQDPKAAGAAPGQDPKAAPAGDGKDPKAAPAAPAAAEEISFKVPEGVQVDQALLEGFKPLAKELGLKSEGAQKLVDLMAGRQQAAAQEAQQAYLKRVNEEWPAAIKADPEIGGQAFQASAVAAQKAFTAFFDEATRTEFLKSGFANHPGFFKALVRMGKATSEDTRAGAAGGGGARERKPAEFLSEVMYPNANKKS